MPKTNMENKIIELKKELDFTDEVWYSIRGIIIEALQDIRKQTIEECVEAVGNYMEHKTPNTGNTYGQGYTQGHIDCRQKILKNLKE